jgi:hypothetical protein
VVVGRIIVTIPGPWSKAPALPDPGHPAVEIGFEGRDPHLVRHFREFNRLSEAMTRRAVDRIGRHEGVVTLTAEVDTPGDRAPAQAVATVLVAALRGEALGVMIDTSFRVLAPGPLDKFEPSDPQNLLQLFVEVMGDAGAYYTDGMQSFGLPDVVVPYDDRFSSVTGQGAAFAAAARMVVDGARLEAGGTFQASESAPVYRVEGAPVDPEDDDPLANPHGAWRLVLAG